MKDNKGFSLVELIVVVLIMAIIAVALAPQILKWVNNSRIANDKQTMDSVTELMQMTVLTNEAVNEMAKTNGARFVVTNDGSKLYKGSSGDSTEYETGNVLREKLSEYAGEDDYTRIRTKVKDAQIVVTVSETATIISSFYGYSGGATIDVED